MKYFLETLKYRNEGLFIFGLVCLIVSIVFLIISRFSTTEVMGVNAWFKPFKFAISTTFYAWSMAWFCGYLPDLNGKLFSWTVIVLLGFEIVYIAIQAGRGQMSHFNVGTPLYSMLYSMMALAATVVTIYTAYIGVLFCSQSIINNPNFPNLPDYYLWGIRLGIFIFVIFSFEGFVMGSRLTHTIGGPDGSSGIPILNWSTKYGDPRVAHFIGMHALQTIPILAFYLLKNTKWVFLVALLYAGLAVFVLVNALNGKAFYKI